MNRTGVVRAAAAAAGILLLAGCNGSPDGDATPTASTQPPVQTQAPTADPTVTSAAPEATSTAPATGAADVGDAVAALEQAAGALPDGQPFDVEREDEGGQEIWEIKVASAGQQHTVHVSLDGSQVLQQRQAETPDDDVAKIAAAEVDAITALRAAAEEYGGSLDEMEIDTRRDGTLVWEIELVQPDGTVVEVDVDAKTGELIE